MAYDDYDPDEEAALKALFDSGVRLRRAYRVIPEGDLDEIDFDRRIETEAAQRAQVRRAEAGYLRER